MHLDRRFGVLVTLSLLWGLLVAAVFYRVAGGGGRGARSAGPERALVVAVAPLPLGAMIGRDAVKLRNVPASLFPAGGFSRIEDVLERPVIGSIQADEAIVEARIAARGSGFGLAPLDPAGHARPLVRVNDVVGVAGFLLPGMRVDVLVTGKPASATDTATRTVLQNIAVLSAGQNVETDGRSPAITTPVVTLLVTPGADSQLRLPGPASYRERGSKNVGGERPIANVVVSRSPEAARVCINFVDVHLDYDIVLRLPGPASYRERAGNNAGHERLTAKASYPAI